MRPTALACAALTALLTSLTAPAALAQGYGRPAAAPSGQPQGQAGGDPRDAACEQLWRNYTQSQACFNRFRVVGGGVRPEAYSSCGQPLPDPANQCGPQRR